MKIEKTSVERTEELASYYSMISNFPQLTNEQEINLAMAAQAGNKDAKDMLVNCNLRFVVSVAKHYNYCRGALSILDLINEGNIGLINAVDTFDVTIGVKFISHAVAYIRKYIIEALTQTSRIVRDYHIDTANTYTSLDAPAYDDSDMTNADIYCQSTDKESDASLLTDILRAMHSILKEREIYIVCNIFGIETIPVSKFVIAERLGLTEERVRQINETALNKLKDNTKVMALLVKYF